MKIFRKPLPHHILVLLHKLWTWSVGKPGYDKRLWGEFKLELEKMRAVGLELTEEERQIILLALANLSGGSPGFTGFLRALADKLEGRQMFESFSELNLKGKQSEQRAPWNPMDAGLTPVMCPRHNRNIAFCACPLP